MFVFLVVLEELTRTYVRKHIYIFANHVGCDKVMTSQTHQDNHTGVVINHVKFGVSRLSSFQTVIKNKSKNGKKILAL